jgi:hypothetical protein
MVASGTARWRADDATIENATDSYRCIIIPTTILHTGVFDKDDVAPVRDYFQRIPGTDRKILQNNFSTDFS